MVKELFDPLEDSVTGAFCGRESVATILLCETVLSLLPSMSVRDMPYRLLRDYEIAPISSGIIGRKKRILLVQCAAVDSSGLLTVPIPLVDRIFLPLDSMPSQGRREVIRLMEFLEKVRCNDRMALTQKAASVLVDQFLEQLVTSGQVPRPSVLRTVRALVQSGCGVHSIVSTLVYAQKVFDLRCLGHGQRLHSFLRTALSFCSSTELLSAAADVLVQRATFVPRAVHHESVIDFSSTSYHILSRFTFFFLKRTAASGTLSSDECSPLLLAAQVTLLKEFDMSPRLAKDLTG